MELNEKQQAKVNKVIELVKSVSGLCVEPKVIADAMPNGSATFLVKIDECLTSGIEECYVLGSINKDDKVCHCTLGGQLTAYSVERIEKVINSTKSLPKCYKKPLSKLYQR